MSGGAPANERGTCNETSGSDCLGEGRAACCTVPGSCALRSSVLCLLLLLGASSLTDVAFLDEKATGIVWDTSRFGNGRFCKDGGDEDVSCAGGGLLLFTIPDSADVRSVEGLLAKIMCLIGDSF
jgi:hypothetical protein